MAENINLTLTVLSVIDNLDDFGLSDGDPEINSFTADGTLSANDRFMKLAFTEASDSGDVTSTLYILDSEVRLFKRGAIDADMRFREGACEKTIYRVGPYAFDMEIKTRGVRNSLSEEGGELTLIYGMNIGGQDKNVRMKITAKRK
jgi:uncharacterized beta-barrel protein YwiB (DUF1934 family)